MKASYFAYIGRINYDGNGVIKLIYEMNPSMEVEEGKYLRVYIYESPIETAYGTGSVIISTMAGSTLATGNSIEEAIQQIGYEL